MLLLRLVLEGGLGLNGGDEVLLVRRGGSDDVLHDLLPGIGLLAAARLFVLQEANVDKDLDELRESAVSQGAPEFLLVTTHGPLRTNRADAHLMTVWASGML